ncbi:MAG TPA: hypothetical protein VLA66_08555 [Thermoanaerobaculia bacterium]|nr:hypothetical protein [Thermoanaerobaculia bacterium]
MSAGPVRFFLAAPGGEIERLAGLDPDRDWRELQTGERAWILQSYLRLRAAGRAVELVGRGPASGLVVFHAKQERALLRSGIGRAAVLVGCRADNRQPLAAEFELLQNGHWAAPGERFWVPHWPQPGLQPRDPGRGARIERIAYKGFLENLDPEFRGETWRRFLADRGIEWVIDAMTFRGTETDLGASAWADFREVDAVLAVRAPRPGREHSKPATKLTNAWLAGVIPILGPDSAFAELRRSELDFVEVRGLAEAMAAVDRLRVSPDEVRRRIEHGRSRAPAFSADAVRRRWEDLLYDELPRLANARRRSAARRRPLLWRRALRWLERTLAGRPAR